MFEQKPPMQVETQPSLGPSMIGVSYRQTDPVADLSRDILAVQRALYKEILGLRLDLATNRAVDERRREARTWAGRWHRFVGWLRGWKSL